LRVGEDDAVAGVFDIDGVDELYAGDPGRFVAARDALARELKAAGRPREANEVKALRRPSLVAAALNHAVRGQPESVDALLDATAEVGRVQAAGGGAAALREASASRRAALTALAKAASTSHLDDALATLDAASLDPDLHPLLRAGRFTTELTPSGFGFAVAPDEPDADDAAEAEAAAARRAELEAAVHAAVAGAEAAHRRLASAEATHAAAAEEAKAADAARADARAALDALS
jgi:hypothetical protein